MTEGYQEGDRTVSELPAVRPRAALAEVVSDVQSLQSSSAASPASAVEEEERAGGGFDGYSSAAPRSRRPAIGISRTLRRLLFSIAMGALWSGQIPAYVA